MTTASTSPCRRSMWKFRISDFGFGISTHPPGTTRSSCHPERGRPTAESKDPPTSPESVPELGSLSGLRGSLDSQSSLGMTRGGGPSLATPKRNRHPDRTNSDREPRSGGRYLAWGVSPRNRVKKIKKAPEGRQMCRLWAAPVQARRLHHKGHGSIVVRASRPHIGKTP